MSKDYTTPQLIINMRRASILFFAISIALASLELKQKYDMIDTEELLYQANQAT